MTQEALGSVHYISPEQARGSHIDARSDIYSAGVVLYEMLTGRLPYEGESPVAVAIQHINSIPLSPRELEPDIPEALEAITMKAMASDVNKRYISADAMLTDLEEFRKNPNINFDFRPEDMRFSDGEDEPTQIIGANTPSAMTGGRRMVRPAADEDATQRIPRPRSGESSGGRRTPPPRPEERRTAPSRKEEYEYEEADEPSSRWPTIAAVGAILIFLIGISVFLLSIFGNAFPKTEDITIPSVLGYTLEQARALDAVKDGGFTIVEEGERVESTYPPDQIAVQTPDAGKTLRATEENKVIKVQLSKGGGEEAPQMPDLIEKEQGLAKTELETSFRELGLKIVTETEPSEEIESGYVIRTDPKSGAELTEGQTVTLYVSAGRETQEITVPPLVGLNWYDERVQESVKGLNVTVEEQYSDTVKKGYVIDQSIRSSLEVQEGASLTVIISKGKEPEPEPTPTQTPSPTPSEAPVDPQVSKDIIIVLPQNGGETVEVLVMLEDVTIFHQEVPVSQEQVSVRVSGSSDDLLYIYFDGSLQTTKTLGDY